MMDVLERYSGWPVVKGDQWNFENWDWQKTSIQIVNDGLIDLILACHIGVNPKNSSEHIFVVRFIQILGDCNVNEGLNVVFVDKSCRIWDIKRGSIERKAKFGH